jgi:hypothetical protein
LGMKALIIFGLVFALRRNGFLRLWNGWVETNNLCWDYEGLHPLVTLDDLPELRVMVGTVLKTFNAPAPAPNPTPTYADNARQQFNN